jgi:hypothetical protein
MTGTDNLTDSIATHTTRVAATRRRRGRRQAAAEAAERIASLAMLAADKRVLTALTSVGAKSDSLIAGLRKELRAAEDHIGELEADAEAQQKYHGDLKRRLDVSEDAHRHDEIRVQALRDSLGLAEAERDQLRGVLAADIAKLDVQPGDRIVLHVKDEFLTAQLAREVKERLAVILGVPGARLAVIPGGMRLAVEPEPVGPAAAFAPKSGTPATPAKPATAPSRAGGRAVSPAQPPGVHHRDRAGRFKGRTEPQGDAP